MFDWNDLRAFLAVAETGSTLAAGRRLRVSQTTVARRVAALEEATALTLFDRRAQGYALTAAGEALIEHARAVQAAATRFADAAAGAVREVGGVVRLTVSEIHAITLLPAILRDLHEAHPAIRIELDTSDQVRDLASGAADIALRVTEQPSGGGLFARRLAPDFWTVYCSRDYAARHGHPRTLAALAGHSWVGGGEPAVWRAYGHWLAIHGLEGAVAMHHGSSNGLLAAARSGFGLVVLPCLVADAEPELIRCIPPIDGAQRGLWLIVHERSRHMPTIRVVIEFLAERLGTLAAASLAAGEAAARG